jgi:hypothetical protein
MQRAEPNFIPSRSRLFHMEPIGVGTPFVESLSGYAMRLAELHSVTTNHLFSKEVASLIKKPGAIDASVNFPKFARAMNGHGGYASDLIDVFERLTLRWDLRFTTMLPWRSVMSTHSLSRETQAWCSACYEEQARMELPVYEQLGWTVKAVSVCVKHKTPLDLECPHCGRLPPYLSYRARPGFCHRCHRWLGSSIRAAAYAKGEIELPAGFDTEMKVAIWVGEIMAAAPALEGTITTSTFVANLTSLIDENYAGRAVEVARAISARKSSVFLWLKGKQLPKLDNLIEICLAQDLSLAELISPSLPKIESSTAVNELEECSSLLPESKRGWRVINGRLRRVWRDDWSNPEVLAEVEQELRATLEEYPPCSISKFCVRTGCDKQTLAKKFPELTAKLIEKSLAYYRPKLNIKWAAKPLKLACSEEPPPSLGEVSRRLGLERSMSSLKRKYPVECSTIIKRYESRSRRQVDYDVIEKGLRDSLSRNPPQSLNALRRKLGADNINISSKFPELCALIRSRYIQYEQDGEARTKILLVEEIMSTVKAMLQGGIRPTIRAIKAKCKMSCGSVYFLSECRRIISDLGS